MKIALGIVRLFRGGGLQSDCLRLAALLKAAGHEVRIFTARQDDAIDPALDVETLPMRALTNSGIDLAFSRRFTAATRGRFDCVVGFNKLFDLDVLYCADPSVLGRGRNWLTRLLPRHRTQRRLEAASFAPSAKTRIIALTQRHAAEYRQLWGTPATRMTVIPPGVNWRRRQPQLRHEPHRQALRAALDLGPEQTTWLWIGTQPDTKGLDRVIKALAKSPDSILLVAGLTPDKAEAWQSRANELRIAARIRWLGYRDDIPDLMAATDLLVHPARLDITGGVILEAVVNGLPVIATEICGFAEHVVAADAGVVLPEPFAQDALETALRRLGDPVLARQMSDNGVRYGENPQLYAGLEVAAQIVQEVAATR